jgi:hypothetical protein
MSIRNVCESPEPLGYSSSAPKRIVEEWGVRDREVFEFPFRKTGNERGSLGLVTEASFSY